MKLKLLVCSMFFMLLHFQSHSQNAALLFDGSDDKVIVPDNPGFNDTVVLTVEAWIKARYWKYNQWEGTVVGKDQGHGIGWVLRTGNNGRLSFTLGTGDWTEIVSDPIMDTGVWYHVAGVVDSGMMYIYINGSLQASGPTPPMNPSTGNLFIGESLGFQWRVFDGAIDEVRIWNIARSQAEILNNNTVELTGNEPGLVGYYQFNVTTGMSQDTAYNSTNTANIDGVLTNFPSTGNYVRGYEPPGYCPAFLDFRAVSITADKVEITWTPGNTSANYRLEYGPRKFTPGSGTVLTGTYPGSVPPLVINGLSPATGYDIYFTEFCNSGNDSTYLVRPYTILTPCRETTIPYYESFDVHPFPCMDTTGGTRSWEMYTGDRGDNYAVAPLNYPLGDFYLTTQPIVISSPAQVRFKWSHMLDSYYDDDLRVEIEVNNSGIWDTIALFKNSLGNFRDGGANYGIPGNFTDEIFLLDSSLVGDTVKVRFSTGNSQYGNPVYIDDFYVEEIPDCSAPWRLKVDSKGSYHAVISFESLGSAFEFEYGQKGFTKGTGTIVSGGNPFRINGLTADTDYEVYIRTNCTAEGKGNSVWTGPFSFRTDCAEINLPLYESFDVWPPVCVDTIGGDKSWTGYKGRGSDNYVVADLNSSPYGDFHLTTQPVVLNSPAQIRFKWSHMYDATLNDELRVEMDVNGSGTWDSLLVLRNGDGNFSDPRASYNTPGAFIEEIIYLDSSLVGDTIKLRFTTGSIFSYGQKIYLNDLYIEEIPPCPKPRRIVLDSVGPNSGTISFNAVGNEFDFEWGPKGYQQGTGATHSGGNPYTIDSLSSGHSYDVYVRSNCLASDNGTSPWVGPFTFTTICVATPLPYYESFDAHPFPCLDTNGGSLYWSMYRNGGDNFAFAEINMYPPGDRHLTTQPIIITQPARVKFKWSHRSETYSQDTLKVEYEINNSNEWNSLLTLTNADGNFNADGANYNSPGAFIEEVMYLDSSLIGDTVRVRFITGNNNGTGSAVFLNDLYIEEIPQCPEPRRMVLDEVDPYSATISFSAITENFEYEYDLTGFTPGTGNSGSTGNPVTLNNLNPDTFYDVYLRANCSSDGKGTSTWAGPFTFSTRCIETSIPYYESFDAWPPSCMDTMGGFKYWELYTGNGGDNYTIAPLNISPYGDAHLTTQPLVIDEPAWVRFKWSHYYDAYYSDTLRVELEVNNSGTWDNLLTLANASGNFNDPGATYNTPGNFQQEALYLDSSLVGDTIKVRFVAGNSDYGYPVYLNDLRIEALPPCPDPRLIKLDEVGSYDASISFYALTNNFEYEYDTAGFALGTGNPGTGGSSFNLSGLTPDTKYDVYIRGNCTSSGDGNSNWVGPFSFKTRCLETVMAYYESFDSWPLGCMDTMGGSRYWKEFIGNSGDNYAIATLNSSPYGDYYLTTQPVIIDKPAQVRFKWSHYYQSYYDDTLKVEYEINNSGIWDSLLTLSNDAGNFEDPGANYSSPGNFIREILFLDSNLVGDTVKIRFVTGGTSYGYPVYLNDLYIEERPSCPAPTALRTKHIGNTSVIVEVDGPPADYLIEYGMPGFTPGTGTLVSGSNPVTITGLSSSSTYEIYARAYCNPDTSSRLEESIVITTMCDPEIAPYLENFEDHPIGFFNGNENCWSYISNNPGTSPSGGFSWEVRNSQQTSSGTGTGPDRDNTLAPAIGGHFIHSDNSGGIVGDSTLLLSPLIDITGLSDPELEYHFHIFSMSGNLQYQQTLYVDLYDGNVWHNGIHVLDTVYNTSPSDPYKDTIIDLAPYDGNGLIQVRFRCKTGESVGGPGDIAIDDIRISDPITCPRPDSLSVSGITATGANLHWNAGGATNWIVEYGPAGFSQGNGNIIYTSVDSLSVSGLSANTLYNFYVRDSCGVGDVSFWSGPYPFRTECAAFNTPYYDDFESHDYCSIVINENEDGDKWERTNYASLSGTYAMSIYTNYKGGLNDDYFVTPQFNLGQNDTLSFAVKVRSSSEPDTLALMVSTSGREAADFTTVLWSATLSSEDFDTVSVDLSAYSGRTVYFAFYAPPSYYDGWYIFIDDLSIGGGRPQCSDPTALGADPEALQADVYWTAGTSISTGWNVEYGTQGFTPGAGTMTSSTDDTLTLTGLTSSTCYDFYVQEDCGADSSGWAGPYTFCTTVICPEAGSDAQGTVCDTIPDTNLDDYLSGADTGGVWIDANSTGALSGSIFDASSPNVTYHNTYDFWYIVSAAGCEDDTAVVSITVDSCKIGLEENLLSRSLRLYPNPSSGILSINASTGSSDELLMTIVDLSGRTVYELHDENANGRFEGRIDISHLANGVYIFKIESGSLKAVRRVVKE